MTGGVIGGGNFIVDYVKVIDVFPAEQTLANIQQEYMGSGGAPYNVLRSLSKLGFKGPLEAVGRIGDDPAGRYILNDCAGLGIDTSSLKITPEAPTSYTLVMAVLGTGKRTFFHQRGANAFLTPQDFDFSEASGKHLHYGYLLLLDKMDKGGGAASMLAAAKAAGVTTSVDLVSEDSNHFGRVVPAALEHADIAFMNEFELSRTSGIDLVEAGGFRPERISAARAALDFPGTLVLHWSEGAAACPADGSILLRGSVALPKETIASVVGSGDAFAAGYLLAFLRGDTTEDCLRMGACCAAASVMGFTCTDAIPLEGECLALGTRYGFLAV